MMLSPTMTIVRSPAPWVGSVVLLARSVVPAALEVAPLRGRNIAR